MNGTRFAFTLKPKPNDRSQSIILTFASEWHEAILQKAISVVFRKKGPLKFTPEWLYAHVGTPVKAITAKMKVQECTRMPLDDAFALAEKGAIAEPALRRYAGDYRELLVYTVGPILVARSPISFDYLLDKFRYWPSSSFTPLSTEGVRTLDRLGVFRE